MHVGACTHFARQSARGLGLTGPCFARALSGKGVREGRDRVVE
jgi:hypothetical protein